MFSVLAQDDFLNETYFTDSLQGALGRPVAAVL